MSLPVFFLDLTEFLFELAAAGVREPGLDDSFHFVGALNFCLVPQHDFPPLSGQVVVFLDDGILFHVLHFAAELLAVLEDGVELHGLVFMVMSLFLFYF